MLNLELPGVSLLSAVSLIGAFFSASPVATRYVSPFLRCIKRCCKEQEQVFQKTVGSNTTQRVEIFSETSA